MRKLVVIPLVGGLLFAALPGAALAGGGWHGGYHGGHGLWWLPGAIIGGLVVGAVAIATAPFVALSAPPVYSPPVVYAPPPVYSVPPTYGPPPATYQQPPVYAPPRASAVQREVVYPNGRYLLYGDGVRQPWQWVWVPSASPPPPSQRETSERRATSIVARGVPTARAAVRRQGPRTRRAV